MSKKSTSFLTRENLRQSAELLRPARGLLIFTLAASVVSGLLVMARPLLSGAIVGVFEKFLAGGIDLPTAERMFLALGIGFAVAFFVQNVFGQGVWAVACRVASRAGVEMNRLGIEKFFRLPMKFFDGVQIGAEISKIGNARARGEQSIREFSTTLLPMIVNIFALTGTIALADPRVALILWAPVPVLWIFVFKTSGKMSKAWRKFSKMMDRLGNLAHDAIDNIRTTRAFARENREKAAFLRQAEKIRREDNRLEWIEVKIQSAKQFLLVVGYGAALILSGFLVLRGEFSLADFTLVLTSLTALVSPLLEISRTFERFSRNLIPVARFFEFLRLPEPGTDAPGARPLRDPHGAISFEKVHFQYAPGKPVFRGIDFTIEPGQTVALVGPSGSGKTTVTNLLLRFYDPQKGAIRIGGENLKKVRQISLREAVGVVLQDTALFQKSIAENIAIGRPGASPAEIEAAARAANAHDFIEKLPQKYRSSVGQKGVKLSGGERQRIAIARAFLKNAPILVLDEATSALDSESEAAVQEALGRLMAGRTTIVIAHRLSTIQRADRILVLKKGEIREDGRHADLVKKSGGIYADLWARQSGGFLPDDGKK